MKSSAPVTLKDIANRIGVSAATVSLALSGKGRLSLERRAEIQRLATELGYQHNRTATDLIMQRWRGEQSPPHQRNITSLPECRGATTGTSYISVFPSLP